MFQSIISCGFNIHLDNPSKVGQQRPWRLLRRHTPTLHSYSVWFYCLDLKVQVFPKARKKQWPKQRCSPGMLCILFMATKIYAFNSICKETGKNGIPVTRFQGKNLFLIFLHKFTEALRRWKFMIRMLRKNAVRMIVFLGINYSSHISQWLMMFPLKDSGDIWLPATSTITECERWNGPWGGKWCQSCLPTPNFRGPHWGGHHWLGSKRCMYSEQSGVPGWWTQSSPLGKSDSS